MRSSASLRRAIAAALAIDSTGFAPLVALRGAIGVAIPVSIGLATNHPAEGAIAAAGALPAGAAALGNRQLAGHRIIAATAVGMALSTFAGGLVAGHLVATLLVLAGWGFAAGLTVVLGRDATVVGIQAVIGVVVFGRFPGSVSSCALHAGWVLAGAGLQGVLAAVLRSPMRFAAERRILASVYDQLASIARDPDHTGTVAASQTAAASAMLDRRSPDDDVALVRGIADEAERIRIELQSLATAKQVDELPAISAAVTSWLQRLAGSIRDGSAAPGEPDGLDDAVRRLHDARVAAPAGRRGTAVRYAEARVSALLGQLRAVDRMVDALAGIRRIALPHRPNAPTQLALALPRQTATAAQRLRDAAVDTRSSAFRHAVRLAVLLPAAEALSHALPWQRGYWVTLTALLVLKPDYAATSQRGIARIAGTAIGVLAAGGFVVEVHPGTALLVTLIAVTSWAAYTCFAASYAIYTVLITALVVLLLSPIGGAELSTVADRGLDTLIGGAIALAGYLVWPTWEKRSLEASVDGVLAALATYADTVLSRYVDPDSADPAAAGHAAVAARRARMVAVESLERATGEPRRGGADVADAARRLAAARRIVISLHALRATVDDAAEHVSVPELAPLRDAMVEALKAVSRRQRAQVSELRSMQENLDADVAGDLHGLHARRLALLAAQLDPLVDSIDTLAHVSGDASAQPPHV
ncbi:MAG TPA: FUSC family protein [Mycobacteriales bacterium]|nr:FUSC family protein [Mycobacteriales bacterium]